MKTQLKNILLMMLIDIVVNLFSNELLDYMILNSSFII